MIVLRPFWQELIEKAWEKKNIIWLMGVRRVGKTSLCQSLSNIEYFDCESPRVRQLFVDPEGFLSSKRGSRIVLDEIHRLDNPSEVLKLAADHYPTIKIIATGSSTLGASAKFKDTLTGRKKEIWLTPLLLEELASFGNPDLRHRLLYGGLPAFFVQDELPEEDYREWIDAYWAKDIQELFRVGKRYSFQKFTDLLLANSGGLFEATKYATLCEVTRQTITNYLDVLEETFVVNVVRPYSTHKPNEIVMAPKVYGFDTGFVAYAKGWQEIRQEDIGLLWEHCVLNEMNAHLQSRAIHYWRDKRGHELDFVLYNKRNKSLTAIECKFNSLQIDSSKSATTAIVRNLEAFRYHYPKGENFVVASDIDTPFERNYADLKISFVNIDYLIRNLMEVIKT
jgi:uncharacterized protein